MLLRPPAVPELAKQAEVKVDKALLNETDKAVLQSLDSGANISTVSSRLNSVQASLGPSIDTFADGVHRIAQYRNVAEDMAGTVLSVCSRKMTERELEGRRKAFKENDGSPKRNLSSVLRGLSRADR